MNNYNFNTLLRLACRAYIKDYIVLYDNIDQCDTLYLENNEIKVAPKFLLVLILDGFANIEVNGIKTNISNGSILCLTDVFMFKVHSISSDFKALGVGFFPKAIQASKDSLKMNHSIFNLEKDSINITNVEYKQVNYLKDFYFFLYKWCSNINHPYYNYIIQNIVNIILIKAIDLINKYPDIFEVSQKSIVSRQNVVFHNFLKLLDNFVDQQRSVSFYAEKLHVTPKYLSDITRIYTGKCASENIEQSVIKRIILLFSEEKYSIKQICEIMNFNSQSFFGRYFKRGTGLTPKEYLKTLN